MDGREDRLFYFMGLGSIYESRFSVFADRNNPTMYRNRFYSIELGIGALIGDTLIRASRLYNTDLSLMVGPAHY